MKAWGVWGGYKKQLPPEAAGGGYQLPCSVIVIANGFSRGLATISWAADGISANSINEAFEATAADW